MDSKKALLAAMAVGMLYGCEVPDSPNFKTSNKIEAPILFDKEFRFLGQGTDVLIDTTKEEFKDLFIVDGATRLVRLTKEENFDFADLGDAVPEVNVDPTTIQAEVGEIVLNDFSSQGDGGNLGQADFQQLTGLDPVLFPAGTPLPAASSPFPVNISISTDFFVSATVKSGSLIVELQNELGFNIDQITLNLNSGASSVGALVFTNLGHGASQTQSLQIPASTVLSNLNADVTASWSAQTMQAEPDALIIESVDGDNLAASQVQAVVQSQDFSTTGSTLFDDEEFRFENSQDFVQLSSGTLSIFNIINQIDIGLDILRISFPGILAPPYTPGDSLVISFEGANTIGRNSTAPNQTVNLSNFRIFALNNQVNYNVAAITEDAQSSAGQQSSIINENDNFSASAQITGLQVAQARGVVISRDVLLNDDDPFNGTGNLDVFNENEAETTEISGFEDLANQLDGIEFTNPVISINYSTNVGFETEIIGAILGIATDGGQVFLAGRQGSANEVLFSDPIDGLLANGAQLQPSQLIKFTVPAGTGGVTPGSIDFDINNSNVADFINNLPSDIRFVGKAVINPNSVSGTLETPVVFNPTFLVDLPIALQTSGFATFSDTSDVDLGDLPDEDDDSELVAGNLYIEYENGIPLQVDVELQFLDENFNIVTTSPLPTADQLLLMAPAVDPITRFVTAPLQNSFTLSFNRDQLRILHRTRYVALESTLISSDNSEVRIRDNDKLKFNISLSLTIETEVK